MMRLQFRCRGRKSLESPSHLTGFMENKGNLQAKLKRVARFISPSFHALLASNTDISNGFMAIIQLCSGECHPSGCYRNVIHLDNRRRYPFPSLHQQILLESGTRRARPLVRRVSRRAGDRELLMWWSWRFAPTQGWCGGPAIGLHRDGTDGSRSLMTQCEGFGHVVERGKADRITRGVYGSREERSLRKGNGDGFKGVSGGCGVLPQVLGAMVSNIPRYPLPMASVELLGFLLTTVDKSTGGSVHVSKLSIRD